MVSVGDSSCGQIYICEENVPVAVVHTLTTQILKLVDMHRWLIDAYLSDYHVLNLHEKINKKWWTLLTDLEPPELARLLDDPKSHVGGSAVTQKSIWPLSLLAFRASVQALSLGRLPVNHTGIKFLSHPQDTSKLPKIDETHIANHSNSRNNVQDVKINHANGSDNGVEGSPNCGSEEIQNGQMMSLEHCYRRHVKPKKQHEIQRLSHVIHKLSLSCGCNQVVDIGAGQGHLSRLLSFGYGLNVTTVEAAGCHAPKAEKFDREVKDDIQKGKIVSRKKKKLLGISSGVNVSSITKAATNDVSSPNHLVCKIDSTVSVEDFLETLRNARQSSSTQISSAAKYENCNVSENLENGSNTSSRSTNQTNHAYLPNQYYNSQCATSSVCKNSQDDLKHGVTFDGGVDPEKFILTGLHACGDLTPTMMRVFVDCPQAAGLASVSCCYMKMSTQSDTSENGSDYHGYPMSDYIRVRNNHHMSWEAREMACHFTEAYRQRLQENSPHLQIHCYRAALQEILHDRNPDVQHGSVKLTVKNKQWSFEKYASEALKKLGYDGSLTAVELNRANGRLAEWKSVVAFYTLRLSLAPALETLLLLDRALFLSEKGIDCSLVPIFDPELSPRNFVLLARKSKAL